MLTLNHTAIVNRWAIVGNAVLWILGQDIILDETPLDDLPDEVRRPFTLRVLGRQVATFIG